MSGVRFPASLPDNTVGPIEIIKDTSIGPFVFIHLFISVIHWCHTLCHTCISALGVFMRFPSYLVKNRFGIYYFQLVFPKRIRHIFKKKEARRSLRTNDRKIAVIMAQEFRRIAEQQLFPAIVEGKMNWIETKQLLDKIAEKLFEKYVNQVHKTGFDFYDHDSLEAIMPGAETFLGEAPSGPYPSYHFELDRRAFEDTYHKTKTVTDFANNILKHHGIKVDHDSDDYKRICKQALEMLYRLDEKKRKFRNDLTIGSLPLGPYENQKEAVGPGSSIPEMAVKELVSKYTTLKIKVEKKWSPRTIKGYTENYDRIIEIFEVVLGDKKFPINSITKDHAREVWEILSIIPTSLKKKYPNLSMKQIITKCRNGEIAQLESERLSSATFKTYSNLIGGLFRYAEEEEFVSKNHFQNKPTRKKKEKKRKPFTDQEIELFFNTDLFLKKDFEVKWAWRFWVPIFMMYSGCRLEEVCQLFLDDIYETEGVLCFHIREKEDNTTGEIITNVKNSASNRKIPVHQKLIKIGLKKYIKYLMSVGEKQLFPDLKNKNSRGEHKPRNSKVTRWFNERSQKDYRTSYIEKCGITDPEKVLYCFRHTVGSLLDNYVPSVQTAIINNIFGHEQKTTRARHYTTWKKKVVLEVIAKIDYPNANLPWDKISDYESVSFPWEK